MGSKCNAVFPLFLTINILFFVLVSATLPKLPTITKSPPPPTSVSISSPPPPPGSVSNSPPPSSSGTCPIDALKLGVCANLLGGLVNVTIGSPPTLPCCSLIAGLVDLEAAICLCTAIRANVLGINLNVPLALTLILNNCGRTTPTGFLCA